MTQDPETQQVIRAALKAAREEVKRGDPNAAQKHLDIALQYHAQHSQTEPVVKAIQAARLAQQKSVGSSGWRGFWVAVVGYALVSLQQPLDWGIPLWMFLAFLLVPGIVGLVVGRQQRLLGAPGRSFRSAFKSAGWVTAFYTIVHLLLIGGPHSDSANKGQERLAGLLTTLLFATIAGLVAGAASATIVSMQVKERQV